MEGPDGNLLPCPGQPDAPCIEKILVWQDDIRFTEVPESGSNRYELEINELLLNRDENNRLTVTRDPRIYALLSRSAISGDNPGGDTPFHLNNAVHGPYPGILSVDTSGANSRVSRSFEVKVSTRTRTVDEDGTVTYGNWVVSADWAHSGYRHGFFASRPRDQRSVTVNVYNGMETLPTIPTFKSEIEDNQNRSPVKNLWWQSTVLPIQVVRMMYTEYSGGLNAPRGSLGSMTPVPGQFPRQFVEQNTAVLEWGIAEGQSMFDGYRPDRERALAHDFRINPDQRAVFASDYSFRDIRFPIRSGYFFNPTGTYTFTLTTEIYKRENAETPEHRHLVDELIRSFRYETNMVFINPVRFP
jgi:hypothetical protein